MARGRLAQQRKPVRCSHIKGRANCLRHLWACSAAMRMLRRHLRQYTTSSNCLCTALLCFVLQAASLGELQQALRVGFAPECVVFDSPAKTVSEIK